MFTEHDKHIEDAVKNLGRQTDEAEKMVSALTLDEVVRSGKVINHIDTGITDVKTGMEGLQDRVSELVGAVNSTYAESCSRHSSGNF